jgi:hypothetical protein
MFDPACRPRSLPRSQWLRAARAAIDVNPSNQPAIGALMSMMNRRLEPDFLAAVTTKYWRTGRVRLTVQFLDNPPRELRDRILASFNRWNRRADVAFTETKVDGQVRVARQGGAENGGYWSYVGTDILSVPASEPTMNLDGFTTSTSAQELTRVACHEAGHTLGFPHEHMRAQLVERIHAERAIAYYMETQSWSREEVIAQVLTPLEASSLLGTAYPDPESIMCYQVPAAITIDGKPILGGHDITDLDHTFAASLYRVAEVEPACAPSGDGPRRGVVWFAPDTDPSYIAQVVSGLER